MPHSLPLDQHGFIRSAAVRAIGADAELRAALARGELERARRGLYRAASMHDEHDLAMAERARLAYLSKVHAVAATFHAPVFTSYSAVALLGLPIFGAWPADVFIMSRSEHGRRRSGVVEVARTRDIDVTAVEGMLVTSIEFTLLQLARHAPLVAALTATDAALHVPRFGGGQPMTTLECLRSEHDRLKPHPRSRRADAVLDRATPLADTPIESGSRLLIEELGFAPPVLQHELWLPEAGRRAFLDFYWPEIHAGAEADGRGKYLGGNMASPVRGAPTAPDAMGAGGRNDASRAAAAAAEFAAAAVIAEKDRENAIRRQLSGFDRWDWNDMMRKRPVEARLARLGVPRTRRPLTLI
ncbi:putative transcriptional regulator of viral defense system [Agromyces sp. 3263]|uniref:type IV toxin-antitoxin system AbiEi family antitoxin domain-containing protein n=1 Tax=Agromyces sp. 3263 TaxID=2817750 RepID=UPI002863E8F2|nr:type IV toxin-antitoxin system AbiEi family antitoxin domain-containing protein [Agromyces sp. 3263]MDR6905343.1 putative transcriptional regulator of viral defense system [Agromyces sp. 3263]